MHAKGHGRTRAVVGNPGIGKDVVAYARALLEGEGHVVSNLVDVIEGGRPDSFDLLSLENRGVLVEGGLEDIAQDGRGVAGELRDAERT